MGTSHSQNRPHSHQGYNTYYNPTWSQPHHGFPKYGPGHHHHHHHHARAGFGFGFGGPRPHLHRRC